MIIDGGPGLTPDPSPEGKGSKGEGRGEKLAASPDPSQGGEKRG